MKNITEDYVSFETAKLLKEKGFPQDPRTVCNTAYTLSGKLSNNAKSFMHNSDLFASTGLYSHAYSLAPTLQMVRKWLRIEYNLFIDSFAIKNYDRKELEYDYTIQDLNFLSNEDEIEIKSTRLYDSPEKACEAAIIYCLENLI